MRPIDADDLQKSLNNYVFSDPTCPMHIAATVDQYIDFAPTVGGWIPCSEKMPEDGQRVLICSSMKKMFVAAYNASAHMFTQRVHSTVHAWYANEITHWMPLPEPPGGDET